MKTNHLSCQPILVMQENFYDKYDKGILDITGIMNHTSGLDPYSTDEIRWIHAMLIGGTPQHLCLTSDEDIEKGDYFLLSNGVTLEWHVLKAMNGINVHDGKTHKRIVATTDKSLSLPIISAEDVQWYLKNKKEIIDVKIIISPSGKPFKLEGDNSVIILKEKQSEYNKAIDDCIQIIENSSIYEEDTHRCVSNLIIQIINLKNKKS